MSFDDFAAKAPSAQPTEDPAAGTAEAAGEWMDLEILDLDAFLGRADPSYQRAKRIDKAWRDDESTRLLLP